MRSITTGLRTVLAAAMCCALLITARTASAQSSLGACCLPSGVCALTDKCSCDMQGGGFGGAGSSCSSFSCGSVVYGACCTPTGCTDTTAANCTTIGGNFLAGGLCATSQAVCPPGTAVACCCGGVCYLVEPTFCSHLGGSVPGNTVCQPNQCGSGACCDPNTGACQVIAPCPTGWYPVSAACAPNNPCLGSTAGVCCDQNGNCFPFVAGTACNGTIFTGTNVCNPNPCPPIACCDAAGNCTLVNASQCAGTPLGTVPCQPNPCPTAVCCDPSTGNCTPFVLGTPCNGTIITSTASCSPNPCPTPVQLVCCTVQGGCSLVSSASQCNGQILTSATSCNPNPCPQSGACCQPCTGACTVTTAALCPSPNRFFPGSPCAPGLCPTTPVFGACCINRNCAQASSCDCVHKGGTWLGAQPCNPQVCSQDVTGACCSMSGTMCSFVTSGTCQQVGGTFSPGQPCSALPNCGPSPACCCCGLCHNLAPDVCAISGGTTINGTVCGPFSCSGGGACCDQQTGICTNVFSSTACAAPNVFTPNVPCSPQLVCGRGACCNPATGGCAIVPNSTACNGQWQGPNTTCAGVTCAPPTVACCDPSTGACSIVSGTACPHGTVFANPQPAPPQACGPTTCPPVGACCTAAAGCITTTQANCNGTWLANTPCQPNPCVRVCCNTSTAACTLVAVPNPCPTGSTPLAGATSCTPTNPCPPTGACCIPGTILCTQTTQANCANGSWLPGTTCQPNPCVSACCTQTGGCFLIGALSVCPPGSNLIPGVTCQPNPCPPVGACCNIITGACTIKLQSQCKSKPFNFLVWLGPGSVCTPNPCVGACCDPNTGTCTVTTAILCQQPRQFVPGQSTCNPTVTCPPVTRACCTSAGCVTISVYQCTAQGGTILPVGTVCGPATCRGACCTPPNVTYQGGPAGTHCVIVSGPAQCQGQWHGFGTVCSNPPASTNFTTCCPANVNGTGGVSVQDIFDFIAAWFAGCTGQAGPPCNGINADFNGVGGITVQDIFDFIAAWFTGCS